MLDLDSLAERQAQALQQAADVWRDAVWSPQFQTLSRHMSDSDVENFLALCPTVEHFHNLVQYLETQASSHGLGPLDVIQEEAAKAGVSVYDWVGHLPRVNGSH